MMASQVIFYALSAFLLGAALMAVVSKKIFRAAIWLLLSLTGVAGIYIWMQVDFIAAVQIVVYVGGIVVLIIFSIFLTQDSGKELPGPDLKRVLFSALAALFGLVFSYNLIRNYNFKPASQKPFVLSVSDMGTQLLSPTEHGFILPFEVVSILLLSAMIGCIVIAMKHGTSPDAPKQPEVEESGHPKPPAVIIAPISKPVTTGEERG